MSLISKIVKLLGMEKKVIKHSNEDRLKPKKRRK
jgi:hypothetical protein